jgi:ankyrin repeat protein
MSEAEWGSLVKQNLLNDRPIEESIDALQRLHRSKQLDNIVPSHFTLLMTACNCGQPDYVRWLLAHGASPCIVNCFDMTALHVCRSISCATLLLDAGADINAQSSYCGTPLDCYERKWIYDVAMYLLDRGAKVTAYCVGGQVDFINGREACRSTALAMLSLSKRKEASASLRKNGRDVLWIIAMLVWLTRGDTELWMEKAWMEKERIKK